MKFPFSAQIILDVDDVCEFAGVADEETKIEIAGHLATIGRVSTDLIDVNHGVDISELDYFGSKDRKLEPEEMLRLVKGQLLAGVSALSNLLKEYDVTVGFNLPSQSLVFVKCSETLSKDGSPFDFYTEIAKEQNDVAFAPLTKGSIFDYLENIDGMIYSYKLTADGTEEDDELDILDSVDVDVDQIFDLVFGCGDDEEEDDDEDDDDDDEAGEEWKKGKPDDEE